MDEHSSKLYLLVFNIAEIEDGIAKAPRESARHKATDLASWLQTLLHLYSNRVLVFDVARAVPELSDHARSRALSPGIADIVIGATARRLD